MSITLVKYRDIGLTTYTWFWINEEKDLVSPFFDSQKEAESWVVLQKQFEVKQ
jgi:hypothetical protein